MAALAFFFPVIHLTDRFADQADQYRAGRWSEERVLELLRAALDGRWTVVRNFAWPHTRWGDVDLVLVGPGGVWAFEIKAYSGLVRNIGDRWERNDGRRWRKLTTHPGRQARRNAARLNEYLAGGDLAVNWVQPVVIWANESGSLSVQNPVTPVWDLTALSDHLEELWQRQSLAEETVQQVVDALEQAAVSTA